MKIEESFRDLKSLLGIDKIASLSEESSSEMSELMSEPQPLLTPG